VHRKLIVYVIQLLVKQELPTLPEHLSSPPVFSEVRVARSLVFCVVFVDRCLSFCPFYLLAMNWLKVNWLKVNCVLMVLCV